MPKLQSVLEDAKEFLHPYEAMVDQCREKLGSSTAEKLCKRKRSKNKLKEARRKRQKAATCTETINVDEDEINPKRDSKEGGQQEDEMRMSGQIVIQFEDINFFITMLINQQGYFAERRTWNAK